MGKSEKDVCAIIETVESMVNPFEEGNEQLLHIASGAVASSEVTSDYLEAHDRGDKAFITYCKERLQKKRICLLFSRNRRPRHLHQ